MSTMRWGVIIGGLVAVTVAGLWLLRVRTGGNRGIDRDAIIEDVLSEESEAQIRAACSMCHVFPEPDILPREYWRTAIGGMYRVAEARGVELTLQPARAVAWYLLKAPETLPPATGRTDAGPGRVAWEREEWWPTDAPPAVERGPGTTHVQMASLFDGEGLDLIVSDVSTNRVYALRPYAPGREPLILGTVAHPGRVAVTDLDGDGGRDVVVAALGELAPTNDAVGSVVWLRRTGPETFEPTVLAEGLGRVADVQAVDLSRDGRTDLLVAVFGWMENGGILWLERSGGQGETPSFVHHLLDDRPGFTDVRAEDLDRDGRMDVVALIAQEFQQVMVYWGDADGYRAETVFQAPNPDWGFTGLEVTDFTGDGLPDLIVTNGDNLDLTFAKPYHGVGMLENLGGGRFEYRHLTSMYGAHKAIAVDPVGDGRLGLLVSAYLPPTVAPGVPAPHEAVVWLERRGPTTLVRRVLKADGAHHMTMAAGDATGDGQPDFAVGWMDLGIVDPQQAHTGAPLTSLVTLWRNLGVQGSSPAPPNEEVIDWRATAAPGF